MPATSTCLEIHEERVLLVLLKQTEKVHSVSAMQEFLSWVLSDVGVFTFWEGHGVRTGTKASRMI